MASGYSVPTTRQLDHDCPVTPCTRDDCLCIALERHVAVGKYGAHLVNDGDFDF